MSHVYSSVTVHIVFATKNRFPYITPDLRPRLYAYFGGVIRNLEGYLLEVGGMPDHVHLLVGLHPKLAISDLVRNVKTGSTYWAREVTRSAFSWQVGFGAFSVGYLEIDRVRRYIRNQERRHRAIDYDTEYRRMLRRCGIVVSETATETTGSP